MQGGIDYAIAKSLAAAPFADLLWMETKTADLADARRFAEAIHAEFPDKMLAYNLSPSFNWDTTGMSDEEMRRFPEELGKLGFVFNFITYGGHQIDGLAAEEFATALRQDGMLSLARLQRKFRLVESPYRTPQTLVGGPRGDAALMAASGGTAATKAMGKGSTQHQHLVQTEVPTKLLEEWLAMWTKRHQLPHALKVRLRPHTAGSELLELSLATAGGEKVASVIFAIIVDRRGRNILTVRDQNTFDTALRKKRLMTLIHLFLIHRYQASSVHYVSPTDDNRYQAAEDEDPRPVQRRARRGGRHHRRRGRPRQHQGPAGPGPGPPRRPDSPALSGAPGRGVVVGDERSLQGEGRVRRHRRTRLVQPRQQVFPGPGQRLDPQVGERRGYAVGKLFETLAQQPGCRLRSPLLQVVQPGGDLDEALHESTFRAGQPEPDRLPQLVCLEVGPAVERQPPRLHALSEIHHGRGRNGAGAWHSGQPLVSSATLPQSRQSTR